jgi:hypothetical protein
MSLTKSAFQNWTARVFVSPPTATLAESTAVLQKLQAFGSVVSFAKRKSSAAGDAEQEIDVVFSSPETMHRACRESPFTVDVNTHPADPLVQDPYNVRGLQSRRPLEPKSMTCRVQESKSHGSTGRNVLSDGFSPSNLTRLHQSLLLVRPPPPPSIADGLGVLHSDHSHTYPTPHLVERPIDLTTLAMSSKTGDDPDTRPGPSATREKDASKPE